MSTSSSCGGAEEAAAAKKAGRIIFMCCTFSLFATMIRRLVLLREVPKDIIYIYKATKAVVRNREPLFLGQPWHHPLLLPGEDSLGILQCC